MKVSKWMRTDSPTCGREDTLGWVAEMMVRRDTGCLLVIDERWKVLGVITDRDICMCGMVEGRPLDLLPVELAMSKNLWTCGPDDTVETVLETMKTQRVSRLPVVDKEMNLLGLVRLGDLAGAVAKLRDAGLNADLVDCMRTLGDRQVHEPQVAAAI